MSENKSKSKIKRKEGFHVEIVVGDKLVKMEPISNFINLDEVHDAIKDIELRRSAVDGDYVLLRDIMNLPEFIEEMSRIFVKPSTLHHDLNRDFIKEFINKWDDKMSSKRIDLGGGMYVDLYFVYYDGKTRLAEFALGHETDSFVNNAIPHVHSMDISLYSSEESFEVNSGNKDIDAHAIWCNSTITEFFNKLNGYEKEFNVERVASVIYKYLANSFYASRRTYIRKLGFKG